MLSTTFYPKKERETRATKSRDINNTLLTCLLKHKCFSDTSGIIRATVNYIKRTARLNGIVVCLIGGTINTTEVDPILVGIGRFFPFLSKQDRK